MMPEENIKNLGDPILEFDSTDHLSTDPIFGLETWHPHRLPEMERVRAIAICQPQFKESLKSFWAHLKNGFTETPYTPYLGFEKTFSIPISDLELVVNPDVKKGELSTRFASSVRDIGTNADIVFAVLPYDFPQEARTVYNELKAASFQNRIKTQCIRKSILERQNATDRASYLWNISVGIFTKVGGTPWALNEKMNDVGCFVGFVADAVKREQTGYDKAGICEIIDNYGSHSIWVKEDLPSMTLTRENGMTVRDIKTSETRKLVESCLEKYCRSRLGMNYETKLSSLANKLVIFHLTDDFSTNVLDTMAKATTDFGLKRYEIIHLKQNTPFRLYSNESFDLKPMRGTMWEINERNAVLCTHGRREYHRGIVHKTYSRNKRIIPLGIEVLREENGVPIQDVCKQIVNLTGLCWYTTDIEMKMPVTIKIARRLSNLWERGVLSDFNDVRYVL